MKKVIKKRNHKLAQVYLWAVEYSLSKAKERKCEETMKTTPGKPKPKRPSP